jgi:hypothetical protein
MDFDPRDYDSRDDERFNAGRERGSRDSAAPLDREDDWRHPETSRERDDDARMLGRGPGDSRNSHGEDYRHGRNHGTRWLERERDIDPREVFTRDVYLPRGLEREIVRYRDREYTLRGSESRTLATVGAFRVVSRRDLRDAHDRQLDPRSSDLRHLRENFIAVALGSRQKTNGDASGASQKRKSNGCSTRASF